MNGILGGPVSERRLPLERFERAGRWVCGLMLIIAGIYLAFGFFAYVFGGAWRAEAAGLDAMSNGILIALGCVTAYVCLLSTTLFLNGTAEVSEVRRRG